VTKVQLTDTCLNCGRSVHPQRAGDGAQWVHSDGSTRCVITVYAAPKNTRIDEVMRWMTSASST
jgi:uncharacterized protein (DUF983 family)